MAHEAGYDVHRLCENTLQWTAGHRRAGLVIRSAEELRRLMAEKITEDVRKYAAEQGIAEEEALKKGREEKSLEFVEKGSETYAKA